MFMSFFRHPFVLFRIGDKRQKKDRDFSVHILYPLSILENDA